MGLSSDLVAKSTQAAIAAIEVYNKPNFSFREEAFAILMVNAWELLLKAKWVADHSDDAASLYEMTFDTKGLPTPKLSRSGNPRTVGVTRLAEQLTADPTSGLARAARDNIFALVEIRDNSAHFINKDLQFGRRIQEVGTASLQNYLTLSTDWFQVDLTQYNFFLMPISFYHGFETIEAQSVSSYSDQMQQLLRYLDELGVENPEVDGQRQHLALRIQTSLVRTKGEDSVSFRWTDDPNAPAVALREEDVLKNFPWDFRQLTQVCRERYSDFVENNDYHRFRHEVEGEKKYSIVRFLDPKNPRSATKRFFNSNILQEFDKRYSRRTKA